MSADNISDPVVEVRLVAEDCSSVRVWFEREALEVEFAVKGCVHVRKFSNGERPGDEAAEPDYMHVCDLPELIAALTRAYEVAKDKWKPI